MLQDRDPSVTETLEALTPVIQGEFRKIFASQICELGQNFVEHELNELFGDYTSNLAFGESLKIRSTEDRFPSFLFPWDEINQFVIASNLIADPSVSNQYMETHHNGRIFHKFDRPEFHPLQIRPAPMPGIPFQVL